jgi:hypothetical protein
MNKAPTFDEIFAVMTAFAAGDRSSRVVLRSALNLDDKATRFAVELNYILDKLTSEIADLQTQLRERG